MKNVFAPSQDIFLRFVPSRLFHAAAAGSLVLLFLCLTAFRLDVPGIHGDEICFSPLLTWMEGRFWGVLSSYHGVSESYLIAPFFWAFEMAPWVVRLCPLFYMSVFLVLYYYLTLRLFGKWWAPLAAAGWLVTSPTFLATSRLGMFFAALILPFLAAGLVFYADHFTTRRPWSFWAGSICWGIALGCRTWALWFIAGAILAALILWPRDLWLTRWPRLVGGLLVIGAIGWGSVVLHNVIVAPVTVQAIRDMLQMPQREGPDFLSLLRFRFFQWQWLLREGGGSMRFVLQGISQRWPTNVANLWVFNGCLAVIGLLAARSLVRRRPQKKGCLFLALTMVFFWLQTPLAPNRSIDNFLVIFPLVPLVILGALLWLREVWRAPLAGGVLLLAGVGFLGAGLRVNLDIYAGYNAALLTTGGGGLFSTAIRDMARFALASGLKTIHLPGPEQGLTALSMRFVSNGRLRAFPVPDEERLALLLERADPASEGFVSFHDHSFVEALNPFQADVEFSVNRRTVWGSGYSPAWVVSALSDRLSSDPGLKHYMFRRLDGTPFMALHVKRKRPEKPL